MVLKREIAERSEAYTGIAGRVPQGNYPGIAVGRSVPIATVDSAQAKVAEASGAGDPERMTVADPAIGKRIRQAKAIAPVRWPHGSEARRRILEPQAM
jgi:hypothetical protein